MGDCCTRGSERLEGGKERARKVGTMCLYRARGHQVVLSKRAVRVFSFIRESKGMAGR